jgi:thiosulfate dehydrogenase
MKGFVLGLILGVLLVPAGIMLYFHFGHPPVAVADPGFPMEEQIVPEKRTHRA